MKVEYYIKRAYGVNRMYVQDADKAEALQKITGRKILTQEAKEALEKLGVTFTQINP